MEAESSELDCAEYPVSASQLQIHPLWLLCEGGFGPLRFLLRLTLKLCQGGAWGHSGRKGFGVCT